MAPQLQVPASAHRRLAAGGRWAYLRLRAALARVRGRPGSEARWARQAVVEALRWRFDPGRLPDVYFEINTDCNLRCPFCAQAHGERPLRRATPEAMARLLEVLRGNRFTGTLTLSVNNEPFGHPDLLDFCREAGRALPRARIRLITNGTMVRREHLLHLAALANPPELVVNDYAPGHPVLRRLQAWTGEPELAGLPLSLNPRSPEEVLSNRGGLVPGRRPPGPREWGLTCTWPFVALWVGPDLEVFQCCTDFHHRQVVGDLWAQGLLEVWTSAPLQRVRGALLVPDRSREALCRSCDAQWWELPG